MIESASDGVRARLIASILVLGETTERMRYEWLESQTGVPARRWKNLFGGSQAPTLEMVTAWSAYHPYLASWLLLGRPTESPSADISSKLTELAARIPATTGAKLIDSVCAGFGLDAAGLAALLSMQPQELEAIRAGAKNLSFTQRLKVMDRMGAIRIREVVQSLLPDQLGQGLEAWVQKSVRADADAALAKRSRKA